MRVYIDFDDVICETARFFSGEVMRIFGIDVPYERMAYFNLKKAFNLTDSQYDKLMQAGHTTEALLGYEETPGASATIIKWARQGHEIYIVTGRPFDSYEPSRQWLDAHGLQNIPLYCVDKYGRENFNKTWSYSMTLEELYNTKFDFAIEDSPVAFEHLLHFNGCRVAVFNRPWNMAEKLPTDNFVRCGDWAAVDIAFNSEMSNLNR